MSELNFCSTAAANHALMETPSRIAALRTFAAMTGFSRTSSLSVAGTDRTSAVDECRSDRVPCVHARDNGWESGMSLWDERDGWIGEDPDARPRDDRDELEVDDDDPAQFEGGQ